MNDRLFEGFFHAIIRVASFIDEKTYGRHSSHKYRFEDNWWGMWGGGACKPPGYLKI